MQKSRENKEQGVFLKEGGTDDQSKKHAKFLGTSLPEEYFVKSKIAILAKIKHEAQVDSEKNKKQFVFWLRPNSKYMAVASLVFIIGFAMWFQNRNTTASFSNTNVERHFFTNDNLLNSLLIDDSEFEAFADATLIYEIVIKAERFERKIDQFFLNSLFLEDALLEDYTGEMFIETIIL
jgi:hypothetical protein